MAIFKRVVLPLLVLFSFCATAAFSRFVQTGGDSDSSFLLYGGGESGDLHRRKDILDLFRTESASNNRAKSFIAKVRPVRGRQNATHMVDLQLGIENGLARAEYHLRQLHGNNARQEEGRPGDVGFGSQLNVQDRVNAQFSTHGMEIQLGSPPQGKLALELDSGSSLVWTQCSPCSSCFPQVASLFNPSASSSYRKVSCDDTYCSTWMGKTFIEPSCSNGLCQYSSSYVDGSHSTGEVALENFTFDIDSSVVPGVLLGCGFNNAGTFAGSWDGIVGLDNSALSLTSQAGGKFSQCFLPFGSSASYTPIVFGDPSLPGDLPASSVAQTPLLRNTARAQASFYYVSLFDISVNYKFLSIPSKIFQINNKGNGGVIMDSGSTFSVLHAQAFDTLKASVVGTKPADIDTYRGMSPCWKADPAGMQAMNLPQIVLTLEQGDMNLDVNAAYIQIQSYVCLAFIRAPEDSFTFNVIGNWQMGNQFMIFDQESQQIHHAMYDCSKLAI